MENLKKSRVVEIDSLRTWNSHKTQAVDGSHGRVVIHFGAQWCVPSITMKPVFEELALSYQQLVFLSIDVDEVKEVAVEMEIKAMPTFVLMKEGCVVDKFVGANPVEINNRIQSFISSP